MSALAQAVSRAVREQKGGRARGPRKKVKGRPRRARALAAARPPTKVAAPRAIDSGLHAKPKNKILFLNTEGARAVVLKVLDAALTLPKESWLTLSDAERLDAERIVLRLRARL